MERCFECACNWLDLDATAERKRLLNEIDEELHIKFMDHIRIAIHLRKAAVLTCAGVPWAIGKQFQLPLVAEDQYELVAGIEYPEPERVTRQLAAREKQFAVPSQEAA